MESFLLKIRNWFWEYPDKLIFGRHSFWSNFRKDYDANIPISHFVLVIVALVIGAGIVSLNVHAFVSASSTELVEGTVLGVDSNGDPQTTLNRVNPLINGGTQLEKDLSNLIYQSLITVDQQGNSHDALATIGEERKGEIYRIKLQDNLYWQDGTPITADDVIATFRLLQELNTNSGTSTIYSRAAVKMDIKKLSDDNKTLEIFVKPGIVIPGFLEAISFKVLPAKYLTDVSPENITSSDPYINRNPVGSGAYKILSVSPDTIEMGYNEYYNGNKPEIAKIKFKIFPDEQTAVNALMSGQVHSLTGVSVDSLQSLKQVDFLNVYSSNVLYNQYWGIYFNLDDSPEAAALHPAALRDVKVRQAISSAINRQKIIATTLGYGQEAKGPIPEISFAYANEQRFGFNLEQSKKLLDEAGWVMNTATNYREKGGKTLEFNLNYLNSSDRQYMAEEIRDELAVVGVKINLLSSDLKTLRDAQVISHQYDLLLYGVQTFIDPDRYELFDSSQIAFPGLNISSYKSSLTRSQVENGKVVRIPVVDDDLGDARRVADPALRARDYKEFQRNVAADVPVVFLYHPQEVYVVNKRVRGVKLDALNALEDRFQNITDWTINLN